MAVYKDNATGTWRVIYRFTNWKGERKQTQKRGFATKREALAWEHEVMLKQGAKLDMTFASFFEIYEADKKQRVKESTWESKSHVIRTKILPYFGNRKIAEIEAKDVIAWQNELMAYRDEKGKPYSADYLKTIHAQLTAIFNHAVNFYNLPYNPARRAGTMGNEVPKEMNFWTKEEYLKFSEAMMDKPRSYYAFEMLYWCGIRSGELLALTPADFDFEKQTVTISKTYHRSKGRDIITSPKTKKSNRTIKMPPFLCEEMQEYIKMLYDIQPDERMFTVTKSYLNHEMERGAKQAGVKKIRVPYTTGSKRGLDTRVSLKQALMALGFKGGTRQETELNQWVMAEKQQLAAIMLEHGIEWEQKGTHEKHLSLLDFEKKERAKEVSMLEKQKSELEEHNAIMQEVNEKYLDQLERVEKDIFSAQESRKEVDKQAEQAKKKAAQYEKKLTEIAPMVKEMEMFAEKYSADPEEVLPEAGTLETGKSYREKKAKPLIKKIVTVLRSVYRAYLDLSRRFSDLQRSYERAWDKVNSLTARVEELWNENRTLKERMGDFNRVERALGRDTVETIVLREKRLEEEQRVQRRKQKRKMDRDAR